MSVRVLLFDLGGVVCRFLPERRLAALAALAGVNAAEVSVRIWESGLDAAFDVGEYRAEEMARAIRERLGIAASDTDIEEGWATAFEPDTEVLALIAAARDRYRTALLTDNGPLLRDAIPRRFPELARLLDPLLFSCDLRARKPAPAIFLRAVERLAVPPAEVLLIDDSLPAVEGARAAGLQAIHFTSAGELSAALG